MKKIAFSITTALSAICFLLTQTASPAFAIDTLGGQKLINEVNHYQSQASHSAAKSANELQNIQSHADKLITDRLTSLNNLQTRLQNDTKLSSSIKNTLTTDIQNDINGLTALKAKIDADTNVTTARADAKTIFTNFYIYKMFEPKMRLLVTISNLQTITLNLEAIVPQIQNLINTLKAQGKDVSQLQPLLDDISSQLLTITTTLTKDETTVEGVTLTTQNGSTVFTQVRGDLSQIVRSGFAKIKSDFSQMRPIFQHLILPNSGTKPTGTAIPTSSVTGSSSASPGVPQQK